jgi:hypothetical protein
MILYGFHLPSIIFIHEKCNPSIIVHFSFITFLILKKKAKYDKINKRKVLSRLDVSRCKIV